MINPLDQQKSPVPLDPCATYPDLARDGDHVVASIDGVSQLRPRENFPGAIRSSRRRLYHGAPIGT